MSYSYITKHEHNSSLSTWFLFTLSINSARVVLNNPDRASPTIVFTVLKPYYHIVTLDYKSRNLSFVGIY